MCCFGVRRPAHSLRISSMRGAILSVTGRGRGVAGFVGRLGNLKVFRYCVTADIQFTGDRANTAMFDEHLVADNVNLVHS